MLNKILMSVQVTHVSMEFALMVWINTRAIVMLEAQAHSASLVSKYPFDKKRMFNSSWGCHLY